MKAHNLNPKDFEMDEIVSMELIGDRETVDITVEDTHMFYANGVYSHNSSYDASVVGGENISDSFKKIMIADFVFSLARKTEDKQNKTARINIIKSRFSEDGIVYNAEFDTNIGLLKIYENETPESDKAELSNKQDYDTNRKIRQFARYMKTEDKLINEPTE